MSGNKCLTVFLSNRSKKIEQYGELLSKIRDLTRSIIKNANNYDEKCRKIKFDSDDNLPLKKTIEISIITIFLRAIFHENNKYYPEVFLGEYLYKT